MIDSVIYNIWLKSLLERIASINTEHLNQNEIYNLTEKTTNSHNDLGINKIKEIFIYRTDRWIKI